VEGTAPGQGFITWKEQKIYSDKVPYVQERIKIRNSRVYSHEGSKIFTTTGFPHTEGANIYDDRVSSHG
jgi:hypothetical protein